MPRIIPLREGYTGDDLRALARVSSDVGQVRRLLALSLIYGKQPHPSQEAKGQAEAGSHA